jgi:hypothetical protein
MDKYELRKEDGEWKLQQQGAIRAIKVFGNRSRELAVTAREMGQPLVGNGR